MAMLPDTVRTSSLARHYGFTRPVLGEELDPEDGLIFVSDPARNSEAGPGHFGIGADHLDERLQFLIWISEAWPDPPLKEATEHLKCRVAADEALEIPLPSLVQRVSREVADPHVKFRIE